MKRAVWGALFLALCLPVLLVFFFAAPRYDGYFAVVEANWDVTIPEDAGWQTVYEVDQGASFHGDGLRYHVFSCEDGDSMDGLFDWRQTKASHNACEKWLDELQVPAPFRPAYVDCGLKRLTQPGGDEILFFWDSERQLLYLAESFL